MAAKILVALDHSPMSPHVFQEALTLAKALGQVDMVPCFMYYLAAPQIAQTLPAMPIMDYYP